MRSISSRSNPLVANFKDLASAPDPDGTRVLLDGVHLIRDASDAGLSFECVAVSISALDAGGETAALARTLEASGHDVVAVTEPVLNALSPVHSPTGIVAIGRRPATPQTISGADDAFILVVADVQDPGNLGALVRVAEAAGVTDVITCGASAHPHGWRALRGSMGSSLRMSIIRMADCQDVMSALEASGTHTVAAVARSGKNPDDARWTGRTALLLGGEGSGLAPAVVGSASELVTIPMSGGVESLNVAAAGAILMYAARRQRQAEQQ